MPSLPQAILFDLDGTLLDSAPQFTAILNDLLAHRSAAYTPLPLEDVRTVISGGAMAMLHLAFGEAVCEREGPALKRQFLEAYTRLLRQEPLQYFAGIELLFQTLAQLPLKVGIVTNKQRRFAKPILTRAFFKNACTCVVYGDTLTTPKPSPLPLYLACQQLKVDPRDTWFVGDGRVDMQAAKSAGCIGVLASYGYIESDWQTWPAMHVLGQLTDLLMLLKGMDT